MPYRTILKRLMDEHIITGFIILDPYGNIFYHTGAFPKAGDKSLVDGYYLLSEWVTFPSSIKVAGVKYNSILNAHPDYWCLTNPKGYGSLVLQICGNKYYFLCYLKDDDPLEAQKEIAKMGALFT
ncbi:MAG: hypothetical protein ACFFFH_16615 [Candidatus Thorarchaeota archaeon]